MTRANGHGMTLAASTPNVGLNDAADAEASIGAAARDAQQWLAVQSPAAIAGRARRENFPVAYRVLPKTVWGDFRALYGVARLIDQAGDAAPGDRLAILDELDADLDRLAAGHPQVPVLARLLPAVRDRGVDPSPFHDLVQANRQDQSVARYATFAELRDYCRRSADPVGRLVLDVLDLKTPERVAYSDAICTALQIAEHLQDVGEDLRAGRIYLPADSLVRFDVTEAMLAAVADPLAVRTVDAAARVRVCGLLLAEAQRARALLREGAPLIATVPGRARIAVAGFVAGGHAALDAVTAAGSAAVRDTPRPRPHRLLRYLLAGLVRPVPPNVRRESRR